MIDPQMLAEAFARNAWILERQVEGLSHEDSLLQTPYNINCLNWVLGHILGGRDHVLEVLGEEPVMSNDERARYARESEPVTGDGPHVLLLPRMTELLRIGQGRLESAFGEMSHDDLLAGTTWGEATMTLGALIHFRYFHDSYHTGQTDLLRQVAGTDDAII
jgi:uncharacterized damage-inducible protein DinB